MSQTIHVFDFLDSAAATPISPVCVVFGGEPFLRWLARTKLKSDHREQHEGSQVAVFEGDDTEWRDVFDELSTMSLFGAGGQRLAVVERADGFVTKYRGQLEKYAERPKATGVLVIDVDSWAANTRLYKMLDATGRQIECRPPEKPLGRQKVLDESRLCRWLISRAGAQHNVRLDTTAARTLLELNGPEFGILDQNLAKLALFAAPGGKIDAAMVRNIVGGWRAKTTWDLIDAVADGDAAEGLIQLDRLLTSGEHPLALLGSIAWSLRRFATASRAYTDAERRKNPISLRQALERAGFKNWPANAMEKAERQLKQLGRHRARELYRWLLEADLALKGSHSSPDRSRFVLEHLFLRLAKQAPARGRAGVEADSHPRSTIP